MSHHAAAYQLPTSDLPEQSSEIEESESEDSGDYREGGYHPVRIGETFNNGRYLVLQKLGWGHFSTVWLAFDLSDKRHVAVKVQKSAPHYAEAAYDEIRLLNELKVRDPEGKARVVRLLDHFEVRGPNGTHVTLVFEVLGKSILSLIRRCNYAGASMELSRRIARHVLEGLDFIHSHCNIIHTDLKPENILFVPPREEYERMVREAAAASAAIRELQRARANMRRESRRASRGSLGSSSGGAGASKNSRSRHRHTAQGSLHGEGGGGALGDASSPPVLVEVRGVTIDSGPSVEQRESNGAGGLLTSRGKGEGGPKVEPKKSILRNDVKNQRRKLPKQAESIFAVAMGNTSGGGRGAGAGILRSSPPSSSDNVGRVGLGSVSNSPAAPAPVATPDGLYQTEQVPDTCKDSDKNISCSNAEEKSAGRGAGLAGGAFENLESEQHDKGTVSDRAEGIEEGMPDFVDEGDSAGDEESFEAASEEERQIFNEVRLRFNPQINPDLLFSSGAVKIVDFGNACWGDNHFTDDIQTRQYRSPEVILGAGYDHTADIWSVGCLLFEVATGDFLFEPHSGKDYHRDEDHLALMMELLGPMPRKFALSGNMSNKFFTRSGELRHITRLNFWSIRDVLLEKYRFTAAEADSFASFLHLMLVYEPSRRADAAECLRHPWVSGEALEEDEDEEEEDDYDEDEDEESHHDYGRNRRPRPYSRHPAQYRDDDEDESDELDHRGRERSDESSDRDDDRYDSRSHSDSRSGRSGDEYDGEEDEDDDGGGGRGEYTGETSRLVEPASDAFDALSLAPEDGERLV
eukprot:CAMPEP_0185850968 /NCGR_PEP_ID=MMETSP1354-20130828/4888_1 /TAXON_ID=708628 /ORGANISM="Erythrolobus madagascarensis, Strain CCMP3276" /LENGTH=804 /DNA_ID=CAMNT_0028551701 /DNA_START=551 /DNA_END=2965 /DNA_ORIENTATION=-